MLTVKAVKSGKGETGDGTLATLSGFRLVDAEKGIDIMRVTVSTSPDGGGFVTLNPTALSQVNLLCATQPTWQCEGNGEDDASVTFVGSVITVQRALNGMTYYSEKENVKDTITIGIYDGVGGDCLDEASQSSPSYRDTCFAESLSVSIQVLDFNKGSANGLQLSRTMQYIALAVIIIITLGCSCYGWRWCSNRYAEKAENEKEISKREQREMKRERREKRRESKERAGAARGSPRKHRRHPNKRHRSPDRARSAARHSRGDATPDYSDDEDNYSYDNYDYDDLESGGGAYCSTFQDAEEIQEMEETLFRLQKQTKSEKNALKKQHLMAQVKAQREKLEVVTEEIVQLEEEEEQQRPVYSTPPRTTSPQRLPGSAGRGGGFNNQAEYNRHMATAAYQMRGASPAGNNHHNTHTAQQQRSYPRYDYTRSPQTTRGRAPSSDQQYMASNASPSSRGHRTPPRSTNSKRDDEPEFFF